MTMPPGQPASHPYGRQPFGNPGLPGLNPGNGLVRVHIQGSVWTSSMIVPTLLVDGGQVPSQYGANAYQVLAGRHRIELYAQWMRRYGQAAFEVDVPPGGVVDVHYAAPLNQFTTGNIGLVPQQRKGLAFLIVTIAVLLAVLWFVFVAIA